MREALVDLGAISSNVQTLRAAVDGMPCMVIVKANGYGHGAVPSARAAVEGGADWLGVADLSEALELRQAGISTPLLAWLHDPHSGFDDAIAAGVDIGVSYLQQLDAVAGASGTAFVQLKVDTGLGRNGSSESEWAELFAAAAAHQAAGRLIVRGLWSHLANTPRDCAQVDSFTAAVEAAQSAGLEPELIHLAATEGALRLPEARFGLVRFGIGSYGFSPDALPVEGLRPAMELAAGVVSVKRVPAGHGVSYGYDYVTDHATTLALVPLGYADGIPRHASGRAEVSIGGARFPVAGRIAMDQFVVDVGDAPVWIGDRVVVFGAGEHGEPTATEWANWAETIDYEIVTRIGHRVPRTYRP